MGEDTENGVPIGDLRRLQEIGVPPFFHRVLLFPTKEIRGRLETPDGKPAEGIDVVACSVPLKDKVGVPHRMIRRTKTDKQGRFTAEVASPGPVVLYFLPERYAARYVKLNDVEGDLGIYKLEEGVQVSGKLHDIRQQPLAGLWVRVGTPSDSEGDHDLWSVGLGGFARWCRTGPGGHFRTAPLPGGEYVASVYGTDGNWGDYFTHTFLMGRERIGEPLNFCILPQKVVVKPGQKPQLVTLNAVPHVNVDLRVADREGKPPRGEIRASCGYQFDGKDGDAPFSTVRDGQLRIRVPHGSKNLRLSLYSKDGICRIREPGDPNARLGLQDILHGGHVHLCNLEADRTLDYVWIPRIDASLKIRDKKGAPITDVDLEMKQGPTKWIQVPFELVWSQEVGDGIYWLAFLQPDLPLDIRVKAEGYEPTKKVVKLTDKSSQYIEITLEKKK